jgi:hypothetical protein
MERELRIRQQIDEVSERAARFCQDVGSLWCATIRSAELAAQHDKVYNRFNAALQVCTSTHKPLPPAVVLKRAHDL